MNVSSILLLFREIGPGPGQYESFTSPDRVKGHYSLYKPQLHKQSLGPGPASYTLPEVLDGPKFGFSPRLDHGAANLNPGPGKYNIKPAMGAEGTKPSFGVRRDGFKGGNTPGPGAYDRPGVVGREGPKVTISDGKRFETLGLDVPGPGAYKTHEIMGKEGPKVSITGKRHEPNTGKLPGPADYDIGSLDNGRKAVITGRGSEKTPRQGPGPGKYNPTTKLTQKSSKGYYSLFKPESNRDNRVPGPGSYDLPALEGPKFGFSPRLDKRSVSLNPGPGQYNIKSAMGNEGAKIGFGIRRSDGGKGSNAPGPGAYNPRLPRSQGQGVIIASKPKARRVDNTPGTNFSQYLLPYYNTGSLLLYYVTTGPGSYNQQPLTGRVGRYVSLGRNARFKRPASGPGLALFFLLFSPLFFPCWFSFLFRFIFRVVFIMTQS